MQCRSGSFIGLFWAHEFNSHQRIRRKTFVRFSIPRIFVKTFVRFSFPFWNYLAYVIQDHSKLYNKLPNLRPCDAVGSALVFHACDVCRVRFPVIKKCQMSISPSMPFMETETEPPEWTRERKASVATSISEVRQDDNVDGPSIFLT